MAITNISTVETVRNGVSDAVVFTAVGSGGAAVAVSKDERLVVLVKNDGSGAATLNIKVGDGINAWAGDGNGEYPLSVGAGELRALTLDSSRFGQLSGENRGCFVFTASAASTVKLAALLLA